MSERVLAENGLRAAVASADGWPEAKGAYSALVAAEQLAGKASLLHTGLPAIFRTESYNSRIINDIPGITDERREQMLQLVAARAYMATVRSRAPRYVGVRPRVILPVPKDLLSHCATTAPSLLRDQIEALRKARQRCDINFVPTALLNDALASLHPDATSSLVFSDLWMNNAERVVGLDALPKDLPDGVYMQLDSHGPDSPHESWSFDPETVAGQLRVHDALAADCLSSQAVSDQLTAAYWHNAA